MKKKKLIQKLQQLFDTLSCSNKRMKIKDRILKLKLKQ